MMEEYRPSSLPSITTVQVVILKNLGPSLAGRGLRSVSNAPYRTLDGVIATQIADLWRRLPSGTSMECHFPPFGLRFLQEESVICEGSVCWECNNIYGNFGGRDFFYAFDGERAVSQELLKVLQNIESANANV